VWLPALKLDVVQLAWLPLSATAEQILVAPSLKVTVPTELGLVGEAVTVAVNVTEPPYVLGFTLLVTAVDVATVGAVVP